MRLVTFILVTWLLFVRFLIYDENYLINNISALVISIWLFKINPSILVKASVFLSMTYVYNSLFNNSIIGVVLTFFTIIVYYNKSIIWKKQQN